MYAYYVKVPRILISRSNFQFIPHVDFFFKISIFIFFFFGISTFRTLVTICANLQHLYFGAYSRYPVYKWAILMPDKVLKTIYFLQGNKADNSNLILLGLEKQRGITHEV